LRSFFDWASHVRLEIDACRGDVLHDYKDVDASFPGNEPQRFVANYRKAGGEIALEYINADRHAGHSPDLSKTGDMFERMVVFVHRHIMV